MTGVASFFEGVYPMVHLYFSWPTTAIQLEYTFIGQVIVKQDLHVADLCPAAAMSQYIII
jgi:hypothetical protein